MDILVITFLVIIFKLLQVLLSVECALVGACTDTMTDGSFALFVTVSLCPSISFYNQACRSPPHAHGLLSFALLCFEQMSELGWGWGLRTPCFTSVRCRAVALFFCRTVPPKLSRAAANRVPRHHHRVSIMQHARTTRRRPCSTQSPRHTLTV